MAGRRKAKRPPPPPPPPPPDDKDPGEASSSSGAGNNKRPRPDDDDPGGTSADAGARDWSSLPDLPLISILERLISLPDLLAFSAACRSWRSLARSAAARPSLAAHPPLLLLPLLSHPRPRDRFRKRSWIQPPRCTIHSPAAITTHRSPLPSPILTQSCVGYSHGNLIFCSRQRPLIVNVFTRRETRPPSFPTNHPVQNIDRAFLTAPLSSPDCRLILSSSSSHLLCWRASGGDEAYEPLIGPIVPPLQQVIPFKGRVYGLDYGGRVLAIQFSPRPTVELLEIQLGSRGGLPPTLPFTGLCQQLVECGGELLLVRFVYCIGQLFNAGIEVYRMAGSSWTKMDNLGDWCLFVDVAGRCPVSCSEPSRWGGRSNCVYVTGPGCDTWTVYSIDDSHIDCLSPDSPLCPEHSVLPRWPSPIWVLPSMFF